MQSIDEAGAQAQQQHGHKPGHNSDRLTAATIRRALGCPNPKCECHQDSGKTHCPAHDDRHPSLSLSEEGGEVLWHCFVGCEREAVTSAILAPPAMAARRCARLMLVRAWASSSESTSFSATGTCGRADATPCDGTGKASGRFVSRRS